MTYLSSIKIKLMKNLLFLSVFILTTFLHVKANNLPNSFSINVVENQKAFILDLSERNAYSISIFDSYGAEVYSQEIEQFTKGVKYMMTNLPVGMYTINIEYKDFIEIYESVISDDELKIEEYELHRRPSLSKQINKVFVHADLEKEQRIKFSIYDTEGELVFDFLDVKSGLYNRTSDLAKIQKGNYQIVVSTEYFAESYDFAL
jgi:hypothetical protein